MRAPTLTTMSFAPGAYALRPAELPLISWEMFEPTIVP